MPLLMTIFSTSFMRGHFSEDKKDTVLVRETRTEFDGPNIPGFNKI